MQKIIVFLILISILVSSVLFFTNHLGLSVVVTRNYASPKATQTLGTLEVFNWWGRVIYDCRTIEVPPSSEMLLHTGTFRLFMSTDGKRPTYGIYETAFDNSLAKRGFKFVTKDKLYTIRAAQTVHDVGGSIGIGGVVKVLPKGAIWMEKTPEAYKEFMAVMSSSEDVKLVIRSASDTTPKWEFHVWAFLVRLF